MVPGFSKQHLCNRDPAKIRVPGIRGHDPEDSRFPNPYLAEVRGEQRVSQPVHDTHHHRNRFTTRGKPRPIGVPGMALCQMNITATRHAPHKVHAGLPREARCGLLLRLRGRPPALEQRGRSPSIHHPHDHAARATLGRCDALAAQRSRRPGMRAASGTATLSTTSLKVGPGPPYARSSRPPARHRHGGCPHLCSVPRGTLRLGRGLPRSG